MFRKVLVANRGEIAGRVLRTLKRLGVRSVAVYSDADRDAPHVADADEAVRLGTGPAADSYLRQDRILAAARATGAEAIHPGYGFLSENAEFAAACAAAGIVFVGPTPSQMRDFGLKHLARALAARHDVPLLPGSGLLATLAEAEREAARIGYPVMLKSTAGGGGIGMSLIRAAADLPAAFLAVERLAAKNFSRGGVFLEKYIERARHIEVQIFGDGRGRVIALGERDCSTQRRNQKIIEETPAPDLSDAVRQRLFAAAIRLAEAVAYQSAGTVEFVFDKATQEFYFLEVNTRLQVEHGVTEEVTGVDLVEWMLRQAAGETWPLVAPGAAGAAIQARVYAEDPARQFRPSSGVLTQARLPHAARVETWVADGTPITPFYDPLLAKIIVAGATRAEALARLREALAETRLAGIETNLDYLRQLAADPQFAAGGITTRSLDTFVYAPQTVEVLTAGTQTTIQDYPGRAGFWSVGVPPSGPMDSRSFRLGNRALTNEEGAPALEITVSGPTLKFNADALVCLTGARMAADLDGHDVPYWEPFAVASGQILRIGALTGAGCRAYLAIRGGFDVPEFLGSRATFTLGKFGGHGGRALLPGDVLHFAAAGAAEAAGAGGGRAAGGGASADAMGDTGGASAPRPVPPELIPEIRDEWDLGVLYGPHGAPDFFTEDDIETFFGASWEVHYNSSRTGVRLIGPKPQWARSDGGEAGLHPSNIHDNAYSIGSVDFTGDMPVILGPDGPSLGGFVCPATLAFAELWKLGQLRPQARVRFRRWSAEAATQAAAAEDTAIRTLRAPGAPAATAAPVLPLAPTVPELPVARVAPATTHSDSPILARLPANASRPEVVYRRAGDRNVLVEYGPLVLDLELRLRAHALMLWLQAEAPAGIVDLTPGIRSLQVHFDARVLPQSRLLELLMHAEESLAAIDELVIPTRVVRLPLSWDDDATQLAIAKYMQSVRADAPWCPSNIEFIRRINGLPDIEAVKRIVFDASYLVLGLGDVYLGAPVATPIDPRHRLVTTKYNPARTWTPENAVGIGGAYLCVYGMEGPGGYQFLGRTCQMWNTYRATADFAPGRPWLLRFFDQIRFYEVSNAELCAFREDFLQGRVRLDISEEPFRLQDYRRFLIEQAASIAAHKQRQQAAFEAERRRWEETGQIGYATDLPPPQEDAGETEVEAGCLAVVSPVSGSVWKIAVNVGQTVKTGDTLVLVESMKMELPIVAPADGVIASLRCTEGRAVQVAQCMLSLRPNGRNE
jgi:urea carboxylase